MYLLSESMSDRIAYDTAIRQFIEGFELGPEASFADFWEIAAEEFLTDDEDEAEARAYSVWLQLGLQG